MTDLVYLDHNILDALLKERIRNLGASVDLEKSQFVYSKETLIEVRRSVGRELDFLNLLTKIGAKYLEVESDETGQYTGRWIVSATTPHKAFDGLNEALNDFPDSNFGFDAMTQKFFGGQTDQTFTDIAESGAKEVMAMLDKVMADGKDEIPPDLYKELLSKADDLKAQVRESSSTMAKQLDESQEQAAVAQWEQAVRVGPKELKNIKGPDVVKKVWAEVSRDLPAHVTFEQVFGLEESEIAPEHVISDISRCNGVYHALNFFGIKISFKKNNFKIDKKLNSQ